MIQFFNTLTGKTDEFKPLADKAVLMYNCGPTVYDYAHIGNFRAFVFEDLLRRFLEFSGYKVNHVMNLTDVDDKTIAGANRTAGAGSPRPEQKQNFQKGGETPPLQQFTAKYIEAFNEDLKTLNCLVPTKQPRATHKIKPMQDLIQKLIDKDMAYENGGSVYYRVSKFKGYGKLSKKKLEMNIAGASERVDSDEYESKEQVTDFVLWKGAKEGEDELGAAWDSPWGKGRPGWHIECSAMSMEELGEQFDIHAGGEDLIFPHHENEIAQSEGATGKDPFVKYWLHCKFLLVDGKKMSKRDGNFYTLRDLISKGYDPMAIRYALLSTHYRTPLNFTLDGLKEAGEVIKRLDDCYAAISSRGMDVQCRVGGEKGDQISAPLQKIKQDIAASLADDLNISKAIASLLEAVKFLNIASANGDLNPPDYQQIAIRFFMEIDKIFAFGIFSEKVPSDIVRKMEERSEVRQRIKKEGDKSLWMASDKLRDEIQALGWVVKDGKPGEPSTVKKKRRVWD